MRTALALALLLLLQGCAAMEPSSTDDHHRVPQVDCHPVRYQGQMRQLCCEGETCWTAD